jgi:hypothetical protein
MGEEGLEVLLDERVERCGGGVAAAVDGGEAVGPRRCRRLREGTAGSGPAGAGRRGSDDGAAAGGALEWRDGQDEATRECSSGEGAGLRWAGRQ